MSDKERRQAWLLELTRRTALGRQEQIAARMRRAGFDVTQASVSRDIHELGLVKVDGRYVPRASLAANAPPEIPAAVVGMVRGVEAVGANLVVVRTATGAANSVGVAVDQQAFAGVAGTIAGDDTIFVAVRDARAQRAVLRELRKVAHLP